jgi:DNA-binding beta-propeller fold protein YncE
MIDKRGNLVRFFDPATLKETGTVDIGGPPHELAISPDHKVAYIPIYGDGVYGANPHPGHIIAIVDLVTKKQIGTIDVSPAIAPHGLRVDEKGTLYAVCDLSRSLLVIDPKSRPCRRRSTSKAPATGWRCSRTAARPIRQTSKTGCS